MTPYEIDILLWYHCRPEDHPSVATRKVLAEGLVCDTFQSFLRHGLLVYLHETERDARNPMKYHMTDRGHAYCRSLQLVPLPEARWHIEWPEWTPELMKTERRDA